jgi:hypothetical protein
MVNYLSETSIILMIALFTITLYASVKYYRYIKRSQKEYDKSKEIVKDIVLSFKRELRREVDNIKNNSYKIERISSKSDDVLAKTEETEKQIFNLKIQIDSLLKNEQKIMNTLTKINIKSREVTTSQKINEKLRDIITSQKTLAAKILALEETNQQLSTFSETKIDAVIPIKREKAISPLTETELIVLETLASEGYKTTSDIRNKIKLSREHTARLMKKLYENGYVERDTNKIPFKYNIKKEMKTLLKKKY